MLMVSGVICTPSRYEACVRVPCKMRAAWLRVCNPSLEPPLLSTALDSIREHTFELPSHSPEPYASPSHRHHTARHGTALLQMQPAVDRTTSTGASCSTLTSPRHP